MKGKKVTCGSASIQHRRTGGRGGGGRVGDFDVHPGWRIALIVEGSWEMVVYVQSRVDEMKIAKSSTAAALPCFPEKSQSVG